MPLVTNLPIEILDYIETHEPPPEAAYGISQRELAGALGYHPCSMSRPLADLLDEGKLRARRGNVRGGARKQIVYTMSDPGRQFLQKQTRAVPLLSGALPAPPNPFVGRKDELALLREYSRSPGSLIVVEGAPGMGKTALVSRHLRSIKAGRVPFWFAVREASSPRDLTLGLAHALAALGSPQLAYYAQLPRQPVGREVANLIARALGDRQLVGVIDDVQFATPDLRHFLEDLVPGILKDREDLLFLVGQQLPRFDWTEVPNQRLTIGGLDRAAAHDLTDRRGGLSDRFEQVFQASLGSPLLLLLSVGTPGVEASSATLPSVVVSRLTEPQVRGLLPIALANEPLPLAWITETSELTVTGLTEFTQSGLLQKSGGNRVEMLQVVRNALLDRAEASWEREARLQLALFYGRSHRPDALRERFLHLVAAEAWKQSLDVLGRQQKALLSLGYSDHLRNALRRLTMGLSSGPGRIKVLRAEANILHLHSQHAEAVLALRQAVAEAQGDERLTGECLLEMVEPQIRMRQIDEAARTLETVRGLGLLTSRLQALFLLDESRILDARGEVARAKDTCYEAFQLARRFHHSDVALQSVANWSRLAIIRGDQEAALGTVDEMLPEARRSQRMDIVFNLLQTRARAYAELGKLDLAESAMLEIKRESEALGYLGQLAYSLSGLSAMAAEAGKWPEALSYAKQASSLAERLGIDTILAHTLAVMCWAERKQGLLEEARHHGERSLAVLARLPPSDTSVLAHSYLAEVFVAMKDVGRARSEYEEALRLTRTLGTEWLRTSIEKEMVEALGESPETRTGSTSTS
ncbi:MAG: AAA family ATPase [Thermoplasmata archaeon]|nr:AAA family ATPase [Thermoplasmata archaeon]